MKRREFVGFSLSTGVIALLNAHTAFGITGCSSGKIFTPEIPRITTLRLLTIASLTEMKEFYGGTIGLPVTKKKGELVVHAGKTLITFVRTGEISNRPFYHFAFNIPENKIGEAFEWQQKKTPIIHPNPAGVKNEIVHFAHWNAHSIFFLDPAGNLLEYIARHDLANASNGKFSEKDILYASEIGLIVDDVMASGNAVKKAMGLAGYKEPASGFWPIGDEAGLLLMIKKGRTWSGHPGQPNDTDIFNTGVTIRATGQSSWDLPGYPYTISSVI